MRESESAAPETTGPPEQPAAHGIDIREGGRPGVPLMAPERPRAPSSDLEPQRSEPEPMTRVGLDASTRVYGTAQPLHGVSGWMRRGAYRLPEHRARHWLLLLLADRVDLVEDRVGGILSRPLDRPGLNRIGGAVRRNPLILLASVAAGATLIGRRLRR